MYKFLCLINHHLPYSSIFIIIYRLSSCYIGKSKFSILLFKSADHFSASFTLSSCSVWTLALLLTVLLFHLIFVHLLTDGSLFLFVHFFVKFVLIHFLLAVAIWIFSEILISAICLVRLTFDVFVSSLSKFVFTVARVYYLLLLIVASIAVFYGFYLLLFCVSLPRNPQK